VAQLGCLYSDMFVSAAGVETGEDVLSRPYGSDSTGHIRDSNKATFVALIRHNCSTKHASKTSYHSQS
jgi:hypothetical protein